jgi:hypothetical protein
MCVILEGAAGKDLVKETIKFTLGYGVRYFNNFYLSDLVVFLIDYKLRTTIVCTWNSADGPFSMEIVFFLRPVPQKLCSEGYKNGVSVQEPKTLSVSSHYKQQK